MPSAALRARRVPGDRRGTLLAYQDRGRCQRLRHVVPATLVSRSSTQGPAGGRSDLDLYVLHDQPYRQRVQRRFNGAPAEIFVNTEASVLAYLNEEEAEGRLLTAHMLANAVVVKGAGDQRLRALRDRASQSLNARPPWTESDVVQARYGAALLVEDAIDRKDADPESAMMLLGMAMGAPVSHCSRNGGSSSLGPRTCFTRSVSPIPNSPASCVNSGARAHPQTAGQPRWRQRIARSRSGDSSSGNPTRCQWPARSNEGLRLSPRFRGRTVAPETSGRIQPG